MAANVPVWKGLPPGQMTETVGNGKIKMGDRVTYTQQFSGRKWDADAFALSHPRGSQWTIVINGMPGLFYVEEAGSEFEKGGKGVVTVTYVYLGVVPADEFALPPFEVNPALEKHPFFAVLTDVDLKQARAEFNAATEQARGTIDAAIERAANKDLIKKLIAKWRRGEETYYLAGFTFSHTTFSSTPPAASKGGFAQYPFGSFSGYISGAGMSWIRKADEVCWSNGVWKITRSWLGGPAGHFDADIYPTG